MDEYITLPQWEKIGIHHHHGICTPLSSLISASSCGIGEYLDLIPFVEWIKKAGFTLVQLLPLNDTGEDPSPYMGISSVALHPIYISLRALPHASRLASFQKCLSELASLNTHARLPYTTLLHKKMEALSLYLDHFLPSIEKEEAFQRFVEQNKSWLLPYAHFSSLKKAHSHKPWWEWDVDSGNVKPDEKNVRFWMAIQYICFSQFAAVKKRADELHVLLCGDIPILINKDSADVFYHQDLFSFNKVVGAPPDMYNKEGQSWGFPLFRWSQHKHDHFSWWKERLAALEALYHMYRLDHIVGFFRLWAIPPGRPAREGFFIPKTYPEWKRLGETVLSSLVQSTSMLPIGEDLGNIPDVARTTMQSFGIPGMKVLRWERAWHRDQSFIHPRTFSPESMTTISTHDSSTLGGWWEEAPQECARMARDYGLFYEKELTLPLRHDILKIAHTSGSLFHVNLLGEYLALFPELSWGSPQQDRINTPGTLSPLNWTFKYKTSLEEITSHEKLATALSELSGP